MLILMKNRLSFTAISKEIPIEDKNIKFLLDKIVDIENIFGNNCYIIKNVIKNLR